MESKYQRKDPTKNLNKFQELIGQIQNGEFVDIKVHVKEYGGKWFIDCRQWMDKPGSFKGPLKKGFQIPFEDFEKFKEIINKIDLSKYGNNQVS